MTSFTGPDFRKLFFGDEMHLLFMLGTEMIAVRLSSKKWLDGDFSMSIFKLTSGDRFLRRTIGEFGMKVSN